MCRSARFFCLSAMLALVAACGDNNGTGDGRGPISVPRGLGKADNTFSCQGKCGGNAGGCWCDDKCTENGDCCPDKAQICDAPTPPICGGIAGLTCPDGYKCKLDGNYPDASGTCVEQNYCDTPADCAGLIHPMCLGSWQCKDNKCSYHCGGMPPIQDCVSNADCGTDEYCEFGDGMCLNPTFTVLKGMCKTRPQNCYALAQPVCGCDGKTYGNDCKAHAAGVSVAKQGTCSSPIPPQPCNQLDKQSCDSRVDCEWKTTPGFPGPISMCVEKQGKKCGPFPGGGCAAGEVCNITSCGLGASGTCTTQPKPGQCYDYHWQPAQPVCGCDNKTYGNDCLRLVAGVALQHKGACTPTPPPSKKCFDSADCGANEYCALKPGECLLPTFNIQQGTCAPKPEACIMLYDPVCGCDGKTHGNACTAASKGVNVAKKGACGAPQPAEYCKGTCGGKSPKGCYCDAVCHKHGDCCPDVTTECGFPQ